jgi:hypothetical protein
MHACEYGTPYFGPKGRPHPRTRYNETPTIQQGTATRHHDTTATRHHDTTTTRRQPYNNKVQQRDTTIQERDANHTRKRHEPTSPRHGKRLEEMHRLIPVLCMPPPGLRSRHPTDDKRVGKMGGHANESFARSRHHSFASVAASGVGHRGLAAAAAAGGHVVAKEVVAPECLAGFVEEEDRHHVHLAVLARARARGCGGEVEEFDLRTAGSEVDMRQRRARKGKTRAQVRRLSLCLMSPSPPERGSSFSMSWTRDKSGAQRKDTRPMVAILYMTSRVTSWEALPGARLAATTLEFGGWGLGAGGWGRGRGRGLEF